MKNLYLPIFFYAALLVSCSEKHLNTDPLKAVLSSENPLIRRVMDSVDQYEVQIRFTQIDRKNDSVFFRDYDFQVDDQKYFYPASTVKFPIAVLALEKLNQLDSLSRDHRYYIEGDSIEETFAEDVSKIFAVSDNHANNRLLEFLGQDHINNSLVSKGINAVRISHRLGVHSDQVTTNPLVIYINDSATITTTPIENKEPMPLRLQKIRKGQGFYKADSLYLEPFDFSLKNYYPLSSQHGVLKRIIFPEKFRESEQFQLSENQREFLLKAMHTLPRNAGFGEEEYYDGYCKFFMYGDTLARIPDHIKIYNKVGFAYGTLTDCAYIRDDKNNIDFMITATILVNRDGIFNDDAYEYDQVGIPFLAALGRELYEYELKRSN